MKLSVNTLIIGAGYAGLLCQKRLDGIEIKNFIIDQGDSVKFADRDYIIIFRKQNPYCQEEPITMYVTRYGSGSEPFGSEFAKKLYKKEQKVLTLGEKDQQTEEVFQIDNNRLLLDSRIYGNMTAHSIDCENRILRGKITHIGKSVEIKYNKLISTIPIFELAKLMGWDLYEEFGLFIQFYPIGVIKKHTPKRSDSINMMYFSDPLIPFYRKHHYGNTNFYEYCINRPFDVRFTRIIGPGKFSTPPTALANSLYSTLDHYNIHLAGRFATWDADFRLDDILSPREVTSCHYLQGAFQR